MDDSILFDGKIHWNLSKVGIEEYDSNKQEHASEFEWMDSKNFYDLQVSMFKMDGDPTLDATRLFWENIDPSNIANLIHQMENGNIFFSFVLLYSENGKLIDYQEGRHRIIACLILGIARVPVWKFKISD